MKDKPKATRETPWRDREYLVSKSQTRQKIFEGVLSQHHQYSVTIPPELGKALFESNALLRWSEKEDCITLTVVGYAINRGKRRWTEEEDRKVLAHEQSDVALSKELGRDRRAIRSRRYILLKEAEVIANATDPS